MKHFCKPMARQVKAKGALARGETLEPSSAKERIGGGPAAKLLEANASGERRSLPRAMVGWL